MDARVAGVPRPVDAVSGPSGPETAVWHGRGTGANRPRQARKAGRRSVDAGHDGVIGEEDPAVVAGRAAELEAGELDGRPGRAVDGGDGQGPGRPAALGL